MDNNDLGVTLRELRQSKDMTLTDTAKGIVSVPFLSKYERGNSDISATNFLSLLDRLNVNLREFDEKNHRINQHSQQVFLHEYYEAVIPEDAYLLTQLIKREQAFLQQDNNYRHEYNIILMQQWLNRINGVPFDNEQVKVITNYLLQVDDWSHYELELFNNGLFCFSAETVGFLCKSAFRKATAFSKLITNRNELALLAINVIVLLLERNVLDQIASIITMAESSLNGTKFYYERNKLNYVKGLYALRTGDKENGLKLANDAIAIMYSLGSHHDAKAHQDELKKYLN